MTRILTAVVAVVFASSSLVAGQIRRPDVESQDAGLLAGWSDREIRSVRLSSLETDVFLGLLPLTVLTGASAFSMVLRARYRDRRPATVPGSIEIRVQVGPLFDTRRSRRPVMHFELDGGTDNESRIDLAGRAGNTGVVVPGEQINVALFTIPLGRQLLALMDAETIEGGVFGAIDFVLSSAQRDALRAYITQILSIAKQ